VPASGFSIADDQLAERRLAAAGLADEAERLAGVDVQRHARDRLDRVDLALQDDPGGHRVLAHDVRQLEQVAAVRPRRRERLGALRWDDRRQALDRAVDRVPAGEEVAVGAVERRLLLTALLGGARAARGEAAAGGGGARSGGSPGSCRAPWCGPGRGAGSSRAAPACRVAHPAKSRSVGAVSTIRPAYMTLIRSVRPATTPMSWVISSVAIPSRSRGRRAARGSAPGS
jgi:hypothetical protein